MKAEEHIVVQYFGSYDVEAVRLFYSLTTYRNGIGVKKEDEIVAAFEGERMVGIFRLCLENGLIILRGFNVLKDHQRKGTGTLMLMKFENELGNRNCYLICKRQLNKFYSKAGFKLVENGMPDFLVERMVGYKNLELNILLRRAN